MRSTKNEKGLLSSPKTESKIKNGLFGQNLKQENINFSKTINGFRILKTENDLYNSQNDKFDSGRFKTKYETSNKVNSIKQQKRKLESRNKFESTDLSNKSSKFKPNPKLGINNYFTNNIQDQNNLAIDIKTLSEADIPVNKKSKEDTLRDKNEELINDENAVKRLEHWELKNIKQDKTLLLYEEIEEKYRLSRQRMTITTLAANYVDKNPNSDFAKVQELQTLNQKKKIRESLIQNSNTKIFLPLMEDLYRKIDQEQGAILLQNINLTKRSFNFEEMQKKKHNHHEIHIEPEKFIENELIQVGNQVAFRIKDDTRKKDRTSEDYVPQELEHLNVKVDDPFLKLHNLKLQGNYDLLTSTDYYRKTVTEKIRIEGLFRKEMMRLSRQIYSKKLEKHNFSKKNMELFQIVSQKKEKLNSKEDALEIILKEYENRRKFQKKKRNFLQESASATTIMDKINIYDELYQVNNTQDYDSINYKIITTQQNEIENLKIEFEETLNKCQKQTKINGVFMKNLDEEIKQNKILLSNLMKEQTNYYLEVLIKGIDVREEGLCWIVRRLLELNSYFDYHSFPKYLEPYQIDYIITISKKQIELIQLKILLKIMKNKQSQLRSNRDFFRISCMTTSSTGDFSLSNDTKNKELTLMSNTNKTNFKFLYSGDDNEKMPYNSLHNLFGFTSGFYNQSLSTKILKIMDGIFKKNDTMMKVSYEKKLEDMKIDNIVSQLKKTLKNHSENLNDKENEILFSNCVDYPNMDTQEIDSPTNSPKITKRSINPVLDYFKENIEEKELFNNILLVRENLKNLDTEIKEMIDSQKKYFNIKYESFKRGLPRKVIHFDLMYAALFGNHVVL